MTLQKSLLYLLYSFVIIVLLLVVDHYNGVLRQAISTTGQYMPNMLIISILFFPIGILLGLPRLIKEFNKRGKWTINVEKLVFVGIPMLYLTLYFFLSVYIPVLTVSGSQLLLGNDFTLIASLIFGYVVISSFKKCSDV